MPDANMVGNLLINEIIPRLKKKGIEIEQCPVPPKDLGLLASLKELEIISTRDIRDILNALFDPESESLRAKAGPALDRIIEFGRQAEGSATSFEN